MMTQNNMNRRGLIAAAGATLVLTGTGIHANTTVLDVEKMLPGEFSWHPERAPEGSVAVIVSLIEQRVHVYRNGVRIGVSTCSTGKPGHETPTGVFTVLQKDKHHHSSTYNNAPMPNMNRLTWGGIALHAGNLPGYPASHGCVRLPLEFSENLFTVTHIGTPVIIAGDHSDPWELTHPGFVLAGSSEAEFNTAVDALDAKSHPSDWTDGAEYPVTTVLATAEDRSLTLIEDGNIIAQAPLSLSGDGTLGEHVFVLRNADDSSMAWVGLTHRLNPEHPLRPETDVMTRLGAPADFRAAMAQRMHPGMVMIVSDLAATPDRRTNEDFVIMEGIMAASIEPPLPPKPVSDG
jgi:L,D-transpeptidase catalytic domain